MAVTHPNLEDKWTLATGIADARAYYTENNTKCERILDEARMRRLRDHDNDDEHLTEIEKEEENEMQKRMLRRWKLCMDLDSRTFIRVGCKQIPEVIGYESTVNWFFAFPPMLKAPILSSADAFKVALVKPPAFPDKPKGADKKLLDLVMRACDARRALLDNRSTLAHMRDEERRKTADPLEQVTASERELERQASTMDNASGQATRKRIDKWRTQLIERRDAADRIASKEREVAAKEDEALVKDDSQLEEKVVMLVRDEGAAVRKAFVLQYASQLRLLACFDFLYNLVPSNEKSIAIDEVDFAGCTPLFAAAQSVPCQVADADEQYELVEKLLNLGADKNHIDSKGRTALGMYRSSVRSRDELVDMFSSRSGKNQNEDGWNSKHERMEELLMPTEGETEADRDAKKTSEPVFDSLAADDEEDE